ncbi:MAG: A/G-specific adenine glycosylase [Nitrospirae bacterium]|nr:A/G-specific adenine glycosylase [Nitrospirota bacterium]
MKSDSKITRKLLKWYQKEGRILPWRTSYAPYPIWLSEIMLQQTQVETVIPYFNRFLEAFPSLHLLAEASLDQVLKQWEGLGYYSRARNLHQSAKIIAGQSHGVFPNQFEDLVVLPGIGRSTAGAIMSLAYNLPYPILDGNVRRVLSRIFALQLLPGRESDLRLWHYSNLLLSKKEPRSFNSALMDLGATICKPRQPDCRICPLKRSCTGFNHQLQDILPLKIKRKKIPLRVQASLVIWKKNRIFIRKRKEAGLLGGLWEFPREELSIPPVQNNQYAPDWHSEIGVRLEIQDFLFRLAHTFTHFKLELYVYQARYQSGKLEKNEIQRWVTLKEIDAFPFSATDKKIIQALRAESFPLS